MSKNKKKDKQQNLKEQEDGVANITEENDIVEIPKDQRIVTVTLESYQNIIGFYPTTDIKTQCKYLDKDLGETNLIPVTDDLNILINESFSFEIDANSRIETDNLISKPALLSIIQQPGTCDSNVYEQLQKCEDLKAVASTKSFDSVVSIYEAFTGDQVDRNIEIVVKPEKAKGKKNDKKRDKKDKGSKMSAKGSKTSSASKKQQRNDKPSKATLNNDSGPLIYGICVIDFLPLFYGKISFTETLIINPQEKFSDERMMTYKTRPQITVTVSIDKGLNLIKPVIMNTTIESIYNVPSIMDADMDYKICAMLPMGNSPREPILFTNPKYTNKTEEDVMKWWPGIERVGNYANSTKYKINSDCDIKNTLENDINIYIKDDSPRLEFNILKRNLLLRDGMNSLSNQIQTHRKIILEIFLSTKDESSSSNTGAQEFPKGTKKKSSVSVKSSKGSKGKGSETNQQKKSKSQSFLHLMSIVDVSSLMYPGVMKVRIASPVSTFSYEEAKHAGLNDSYFIPKPITEVHDVLKKEPGGKKEKEKKSKTDKSSDAKSAKSSKKGEKGVEEKVDLKPLLPPKPEPIPEPEPSSPVYTEDGKPCFIILEFEVSEPIFAKREMEDLNDEFEKLLQKKCQNVSKVVLTGCLSKDFYKEVLNEITRDIHVKYHQFLEENQNFKDNDFIKCLQSTGVYQIYLTSIIKATSLLVTSKFRYEECSNKKSKTYQNFIGEVFVHLVSGMNESINRLLSSGLEPVITLKREPMEKYFFYGKEAAQLGKQALADRYFLERICYDETHQNPNYWFDYAIFNLETNNLERAFECVYEALTKNAGHKYSLLLFGVLLANKDEKDEAETCFLNLMIREPRWLEGWGVLYLFYQKYTMYEGMDMALFMAKKYVDDERILTDYFTEFEDLAWTYKICPNTIFFRTAILLLKMRLYKDYAVSSLSGHCLFALKKYEEAKEEYYHVLESFNRPDDVHMVYVNCAQVLQNLKDDQEARKLILLACKYSPSPYTWFRAGQIYLQENDLSSGEECFSESNFIDNRCAETWGYLTLINLKMNRVNEAELCYFQAQKNKLKNAMLEDTIHREFEKFKLFVT